MSSLRLIVQCDVCLTDHPGADSVNQKVGSARELAKRDGWQYMVLNGVGRDICLECWESRIVNRVTIRRRHR